MSSTLREDSEPAEIPLDLNDILFKLSRDLDVNEVQRFKFLPKTKLTKSVSFRQVLQTLEERTLIRQEDPWFLIEILLKIGRDELVGSCFPGTREDVIKRQVPTGKVSNYRLKLFDIAINLYEHNISELIDRFKDIPKSVQEKTQTAFDLLRLLEEKTVIHKDNTEKLQVALRDIGRFDLADNLQYLHGPTQPTGLEGRSGTPELTASISLHPRTVTSFHNPQGGDYGTCSKMKTSHIHLLADAGLSVGRNSNEGTGFRVGSKYIMTASHVLKGTLGINEHQPTSRDAIQDHLTRKGLTIDFKFASPHLDDHRPVAFPLKEIVFFSDRSEMDVAIVELAPIEGTPLPLPLNMFYGNQNSVGETFHLLGHDRGADDQEIGFSCTTLTDVMQFQSIFKQLSARGVNVSDINILGNFQGTEELVHFQGSFKWGGSGSSGVIVRDNKVKVFIMLLQGHFEYPGIPEELKIPHLQGKT